MGILLSKLIKNIGVAVQKANRAIEEAAAKIYLQQAYVVNDADKANIPIAYTLNIPAEGDSQKQINVPLTALMHNTTLQLESVNVHLRFYIDEDDGEIMVTVKPQESIENSLQTSELSLQFKSSPPPEGKARVVDRYISTL